MKSSFFRYLAFSPAGSLIRPFLSFVIAVFAFIFTHAFATECLAAKTAALKRTFHASENKFSDDEFLNMVEKGAVNYFLKCMDPETGLTLDRSPNSGEIDYSYSPSTTAGVGFGLTCLAAGAERGWIERERARRITLNTLRHFYEKMEHVNGFFYHFTDMKTGERVWNCELSSIDTALFIAGAVFAGEYYADAEIKKYASLLYYRVNWRWMTEGGGGKHLCMGWKPESGFLKHNWSDYCESMIMYLLAIGSPTYPVSSELWKNINRPYGEYDGAFGHIFCPPLFTHQYSHIWIDFSNKNDGYADYFYNSKMATLANRQFCIDNAGEYPSFAGGCFGLTACIGPDGYMAYGAPPGPPSCDGTVAPTAAGSSIIFTPEESIAALRHIYDNYREKVCGEYGFCDSFNAGKKWFAKDAYAINQGPMALMIENYRSGLIHKVFMKNERIKKAMALAGFLDSEGFTHDLTKLKKRSHKIFMMRDRPVHSPAKAGDSFGPKDAGFDSAIWEGFNYGGGRRDTVENGGGKDTGAAVISGSSIVLDEAAIQGGESGQKGYRVEAELRANSNYLFIRCRVTDSELISKNPDEKLYMDDAVELFFDPDGDGFHWGGKNDIQLIVSPRRDLNGIRIGDAWFKGEKLKTVESFYRKLDNGYEFILAVPRERFISGRPAGFSLAAHNLDEKLASNCKYMSFFAEPGIVLGRLEIR